MALSKREKNLAIITGALVAALGCWLLLSAVSAPARQRRATLHNLQQQLERKNRQIEAAQKSQDQLAQWRRRSLPSNLEMARSLYKNWLLGLATDAGLQDRRVEPGEGRPQGDIYQVLPFTVRGRGTLDELTKFLYGFYSKGHLHKIRQLTLKPLEGSADLQLTISIEALSLPDADRQDKLSEKLSEWLDGSTLAEYQKIGERDLFSAYEEPRAPVVYERPQEPPPPRFDPSEYAYVTGLSVDANGRSELWLKARTTGELFILGEGDEFQVGQVRGTIVQINDQSAEIHINGQRHLIALGKSLGEARQLPHTSNSAAASASGLPADESRPESAESSDGTGLFW